ncbi:MAG: phosphodiester glycosidase family protein [bacterium]
MFVRPAYLVAVVASVVTFGCVGRVYSSPTLAPLPWPTDTVQTRVIADGVTQRYVYSPRGPWAVQVLDVDLARCNAAVSVKGLGSAPSGAAGRVRTTELLRGLSEQTQVIGGVNADFFSLAAPLGVPVGALVVDGIVVAGPGDQSVLAVDSAGVPRITMLHVNGTLTTAGRTLPVTNWNRVARGGIAFLDAHYAPRTDTASGVIEVIVTGRNPSRVIDVDTLTLGVGIPADGGVIIAGPNAPAAARAALRSLVAGDTVRVDVALSPLHPRDAVGGRPWLIRDGVVNASIDSGGPASFNVGRNPRTAAGLADNGRRLILAVVDGRQKPYSDGMSLRELATLMTALGARDAINLDGGGSTTLVFADPDTRALRIANRPSDKEGERAVGDALAIVKRCR